MCHKYNLTKMCICMTGKLLFTTSSSSAFDMFIITLYYCLPAISTRYNIGVTYIVKYHTSYILFIREGGPYSRRLLFL